MKGIERVLENPGEFAYLLESKSADYAMAKHCGLSTVGGNINMRSYGIAVKQGNKKAVTLEETKRIFYKRRFLLSRDPECRSP